MTLDEWIEFARRDDCLDQMAPSDLRQLVGTVVACDRFFREAMPKMNVADSALDANAIDAWNKAEIAVSKFNK